MKRILLGLALFVPVATFTLGCKAEFQEGSYNGFLIVAESPFSARYTEFNIVFRREGDRWTGYMQPRDEQAVRLADIAFGSPRQIAFKVEVTKNGRAETMAFDGEVLDDKIEGRVKTSRQRKDQSEWRTRPGWLIVSKQGIKMTSEEAKSISDEHNVTEFMRNHSQIMKQAQTQPEQSRVLMAMLYERIRELPPGLTTLFDNSSYGDLPYRLNFFLKDNFNKHVAEVIYKADFDFVSERWSESFDIEWRNRQTNGQ